MKQTRPKVHLGIPVSRLIQIILLLALCVTLLVVEIRYHRLDPEVLAAARQAEQTEKEAEAAANFEVFATAETEPGRLINEQTVIINGEAVEGFQMPDAVDFGAPEDYFALPGICTFRGNNYRNGAAWGSAGTVTGKAEIVWERASTSLQAPDGNVWTGSGWTGQPLIAQWTKQQRSSMQTMHDWAKAQDTLTEVIYATMDGNVYFFELETGKPTRDPLFLGFTFKGAGALDPRGWPILYLGAGYQSVRGEGRVLIVNLCDGT